MGGMKRWVEMLLLAGLVGLQAASTGQAGPKPWMLSFTAGAEFTDNRDGTDADKDSNLDLIGTPRFDFMFDNERTALGFFLSPSVKWRSNPRETADGEPQNDSEIYAAVGATFSHQFSDRAWLNLGDTFDYTDDPEITAGGAAMRRSANYISNRGYAGFGVGFTRLLWLELQGEGSLKRFEDDAVADTENEDVYGGEARLAFKVAKLTKLFTMFRASAFENSSTERNRGATVFTGGAGIEQGFSQNLRAGLTIGGQKAQYDEDALNDSDMFYAEAMAQLGASPLRFTVNLMYGYYAPYVRPYSLQELASATGTLEFDIVRDHLIASLRGQYSSSDYPGENVPGLAPLPGGKDNLAEIGWGLVYKINRNFSLSTGYMFQNWDSDVRESFSKNTVNFAARAQL